MVSPGLMINELPSSSISLSWTFAVWTNSQGASSYPSVYPTLTLPLSFILQLKPLYRKNSAPGIFLTPLSKVTGTFFPFSLTQYGGAEIPRTFPEPYTRLIGSASLSLLVIKKFDSGIPAGFLFILGNAFLPEEGLSAVFVLYIKPGIKNFGSFSSIISLICTTPLKSSFKVLVIRTFTLLHISSDLFMEKSVINPNSSAG